MIKKEEFLSIYNMDENVFEDAQIICMISEKLISNQTVFIVPFTILSNIKDIMWKFREGRCSKNERAKGRGREG